MPRELQELKRFDAGTVLTSSERDIMGDANAFSLNINPLAPDGILDSINEDKFMFSFSNTFDEINNPIKYLGLTLDVLEPLPFNSNLLIFSKLRFGLVKNTSSNK